MPDKGWHGHGSFGLDKAGSRTGLLAFGYGTADDPAARLFLSLSRCGNNARNVKTVLRSVLTLHRPYLLYD
ncbi:MAG: hypothetical protein NTV46_01120 [Verrucomicrobia bacterium]|nr:hypothetical protein [Verrucomicrobiota bacterium]